ncbi:MAG TPA: DNA polymerase III subunit delta' [Xanthobacteraceae bacterium]|nr:DNA polymerase III subunit delta' [Xanthobacteraceae bacterium]
MNAAESKSDEIEIPHPRETNVLFGHAEAEAALLDAYRSGRIPHAWLIGGERGIGKATLAYRLARFVLAHPNPAAPTVQKAQTLAVPADHPVARRIASQSHSDLLALERTLNDKGKLRQDIAVDDVRRSVPFFGSTAGEGGWRVAIVDAVDELNAAGANALLKIVEEPPPRALLLLVSHAPGRALATIRSRCRRLSLRPLAAADVAKAAAAALGEKPDAPEIRTAAAAADGSVARALMFLSGSALELRQQVSALLDKLPAVDPAALHELGDSLAGTEAETFDAFMDTINAWLSARLARSGGTAGQLAPLAEAWEQVNRSAREVDAYNLDRKPFVFAVFGALANAARG